MAKERVSMYRNVGTEQTPIWEIWFAKTVADAVMMSDNDGENVNIKQYVDQKIADLIGSAPETYDTLKEIADYIAAHEEVAEALNQAITNKADKDHTHSEATQSTAGFMSANDKNKLDGLQNYTHPSYTPQASGMYKVTVDETGHVSGATAVTKEDITGLGIPGQDTTYSQMTGASAEAPGTAGLVPAPAAGDQGKFLTGAGTWATPQQATVDGELSATSENAVQNKVVYAALENKVDKEDGKGLSSNDYTTEEKEKLAGIAAGATQVIFASTLPETAPAGTVCFLI